MYSNEYNLEMFICKMYERLILVFVYNINQISKDIRHKHIHIKLDISTFS